MANNTMTNVKKMSIKKNFNKELHQLSFLYNSMLLTRYYNRGVFTEFGNGFGKLDSK